MKVKVNRKHFVEVDNIEKIEKRGNECWIFRKEGYPKIIKSEGNIDNLLLRMINAGVHSEKINKYK